MTWYNKNKFAMEKSGRAHESGRYTIPWNYKEYTGRRELRR
jgi:hypothetical protein